jgi:hypothetical protein
MTYFRVYCIDNTGHIVYGEDVQSDNLPMAIEFGRRICAKQAHQPVIGIEIWQGNKRLYHGPHRDAGTVF